MTPISAPAKKSRLKLIVYIRYRFEFDVDGLKIFRKYLYIVFHKIDLKRETWKRMESKSQQSEVKMTTNSLFPEQVTVPAERGS